MSRFPSGSSSKSSRSLNLSTFRESGIPFISRLALATLFLIAGFMHFIATDLFARIVPPYIPEHRAVVYLSGLAEITGSIGLLMPKFRCKAGAFLIVLLIAVFPANVYMASSNIQVTSHPVPEWVLWGRLLLQPVLIVWVWWSSRASRPVESGN